eukprot:1176978-Alexandrium_andersonii.AAC.1
MAALADLMSANALAKAASSASPGNTATRVRLAHLQPGVSTRAQLQLSAQQRGSVARSTSQAEGCPSPRPSQEDGRWKLAAGSPARGILSLIHI